MTSLFLSYLSIIIKAETQSKLEIGAFMIENKYLLLGLLVGVVVAILMRKTFNTKP
jgi:F0F1-type ATP synthase assembly protein I